MRKEYAPRSLQSPAGGFSLMEILVSLMILTTLSIGLFSLFILAQKGTSMGDDKTIAIQALEKALGELKASTKFKDWPPSNQTAVSCDEEVPCQATVPGLKEGTLAVTAANGTVTTQEFKELTAVVTWTNAAGKRQSVQAVTGIYKAS